jgi:diaminopimelate decarboxylase
VLYLKTGGNKKFAIVDTGMHHLMRPSLYDAAHFIWPISNTGAMNDPIHKRLIVQDNAELVKYDIVGPICESSDYLAKDRKLPQLRRGDILAIFTCGAYGMVMSNNYNATSRPPEVMVNGKEVYLIRERESYEDLLSKSKNTKL